MLAVIFELEPVAERKQEYLDFAAQLASELTHIDGFISIERFESLSQPGKLAQHAGRDGIFSDYRLRVASVIRDYGLRQRDEAPDDSKGFHR